MDFETYSERLKGFVQSAQSLALRENHQRWLPEHLLKVFIDDDEGLCARLIEDAGGDAKAVATALEAALERQPRIEGTGAGPALCGARDGQGAGDGARACGKGAGPFRHRRAHVAGARHGAGRRHGENSLLGRP